MVPFVYLIHLLNSYVKKSTFFGFTYPLDLRKKTLFQNVVSAQHDYVLNWNS